MPYKLIIPCMLRFLPKVEEDRIKERTLIAEILDKRFDNRACWCKVKKFFYQKDGYPGAVHYYLQYDHQIVAAITHYYDEQGEFHLEHTVAGERPIPTTVR